MTSPSKPQDTVKVASSIMQFLKKKNPQKTQTCFKTAQRRLAFRAVTFPCGNHYSQHLKVEKATSAQASDDKKKTICSHQSMQCTYNPWKGSDRVALKSVSENHNCIQVLASFSKAQEIEAKWAGRTNYGGQKGLLAPATTCQISLECLHFPTNLKTRLPLASAARSRSTRSFSTSYPRRARYAFGATGYRNAASLNESAAELHDSVLSCWAAKPFTAYMKKSVLQVLLFPGLTGNFCTIYTCQLDCGSGSEDIPIKRLRVQCHLSQLALTILQRKKVPETQVFLLATQHQPKGFCHIPALALSQLGKLGGLSNETNYLIFDRGLLPTHIYEKLFSLGETN